MDQMTKDVAGLLWRGIGVWDKSEYATKANAMQTPDAKPYAESGEDGLIPLAKEILSKYTGHAPVSWLQRKLRIDFARAYKLYHAIAHEPSATAKA